MGQLSALFILEQKSLWVSVLTAVPSSGSKQAKMRKQEPGDQQTIIKSK